eukprot:m.112246 g.112246  ORF g.112246 m.112246 type:complete len:342 (+) comp12964_c0_seq1:6141-7166(+)
MVAETRRSSFCTLATRSTSPRAARGRTATRGIQRSSNPALRSARRWGPPTATGTAWISTPSTRTIPTSPRARSTADACCSAARSPTLLPLRPRPSRRSLAEWGWGWGRWGWGTLSPRPPPRPRSSFTMPAGSPRVWRTSRPSQTTATPTSSAQTRPSSSRSISAAAAAPRARRRDRPPLRRSTTTAVPTRCSPRRRRPRLPAAVGPPPPRTSRPVGWGWGWATEWGWPLWPPRPLPPRPRAPVRRSPSAPCSMRWSAPEKAVGWGGTLVRAGEARIRAAPVEGLRRPRWRARWLPSLSRRSRWRRTAGATSCSGRTRTRWNAATPRWRPQRPFNFAAGSAN